MHNEKPHIQSVGKIHKVLFDYSVGTGVGTCNVGDRVEVKYGHTLQTPRKLLVLGSQVGDYLATLEEEHRQQVYYGMMLLKILSDFNVTFVNYCKEAICELRTSLRGYGYSTYFYLNGDSIVLL